MVLAGIQSNNPGTGLRRYDAWDLDTHLCGVVLSGWKSITEMIRFLEHLSTRDLKDQERISED
jgi:hypothetical protein